jgi:hypothetical protein
MGMTRHEILIAAIGVGELVLIGLHWVMHSHLPPRQPATR